MLEDRRALEEDVFGIVGVCGLRVHHRVADVGEKLLLRLQQDLFAALAVADLRKLFQVVRVGEGVVEGLCERLDGVRGLHFADELAFPLGFLHQFRGLLEQQFRRSGHRRRMGAPREEDLVAIGFAFALFGEGLVRVLKRLERVAARLGIHVGHVAVRVVLRPVVAIDEAGLDAVALELVEEHGIRVRPVDAHPDAEKPLLDLVLDGGLLLAEDRLQAAQAGRLVALCRRLGLLASLERMDIRVHIVLRVCLLPGLDLLLDIGNRLVQPPCRHAGDVLRRLALLEVAGQRLVGDLLSDELPHPVREFAHLRACVEQAADFADVAVEFDGFKLRQRRLHVRRPEGLVHLGARPQDGVERMGAEDAVRLLQRRLEGRHRRVVGLRAVREDEVAEAHGGVAAFAAHDDVARREGGRVGDAPECIDIQWHGDACQGWMRKSCLKRISSSSAGLWRSSLMRSAQRSQSWRIFSSVAMKSSTSFAAVSRSKK